MSNWVPSVCEGGGDCPGPPRVNPLPAAGVPATVELEGFVPPHAAQPACPRETALMTTTCSPARLLPCLLAGLAFAATARAAAADLDVFPREVVFADAYDGRQLVVCQGGHDLTRAARYASSDAAVVRVDGRGHLRPAGDGAAQVVVRHGSAEARVGREKVESGGGAVV